MYWPRRCVPSRRFAQRLIHEWCNEGSPAMTDRTFWQLAKWCKTGGAYAVGMEHAQNISMAVFGRIIESVKQRFKYVG
jgi:hypothetical protein